MGVSLTDKDHVALYDDVTHVSFGPIFESEEHAEDYLVWVQRKVGVEVRDLSRRALATLYDEWFDDRVDGETGALKEEAHAGQ